MTEREMQEKMEQPIGILQWIKIKEPVHYEGHPLLSKGIQDIVYGGTYSISPLNIWMFEKNNRNNP